MKKQIKNILITGASSGIGEALALYYAQNGAENLFLCGRNAMRVKRVMRLCRKYGAHVEGRVIDVCAKENFATWFNACNRKAPLDLVIANAGVSTSVETGSNVYNTFETNVFGVLNTIFPAINAYKRRLKEERGIVAIISSLAGYHGLAGCPSYSASKACVKAYGEALRARLCDENIQVNVICPGFVRSRITAQNTCPMPFIMDADKAARLIAQGIENNRGLIAFPFPMRLAAWFGSVLPECVSHVLFKHLPYKV